jgi:hypothetical protein
VVNIQIDDDDGKDEMEARTVMSAVEAVRAIQKD